MSTDVRTHYDLLIAEGNDPVLDPPELAAYMDGWDGPAFLGLLALTGTERVLEIGVGTGRLAVRTLPRCRAFTGIDLSPATILRAQGHLPEARLLCGDFLTADISGPFDVIYSSLTLLHIRDKAAAINRMADLLAPGGRVVLSLDKEQSSVLDYGSRQITVYPDTPEDISCRLRHAGLTVTDLIGIENAWLLRAIKKQEATT